MNSIERAAADVALPYRGTIWSDDTSTTDQYFDLDQTVTNPLTGLSEKKYFRGRYITIQALSADLYLACVDTNSRTITPTAVAGDLAVANCIVIPAGQSLSFFVPHGGQTTNYQYLVHRTASGTGSMRLWASSRKVSG
jgi:hypothetical protein